MAKLLFDYRRERLASSMKKTQNSICSGRAGLSTNNGLSYKVIARDRIDADPGWKSFNPIHGNNEKTRYTGKARGRDILEAFLLLFNSIWVFQNSLCPKQDMSQVPTDFYWE